MLIRNQRGRVLQMVKKKQKKKGEFTTLPKRLQYNSRKLAIGTVQNKKREKHLFIFFLIFLSYHQKPVWVVVGKQHNSSIHTARGSMQGNDMHAIQC